MRALGIILLAIMILTACAPPIEGTVVGKDFDPARSESYWTSERRACGTETYTTTSTVNGKTTSTTKTRTKYCNHQVQRVRNVPASWSLTVRADNGEQRSIPVSRSVYDKTKIGDRVNSAKL